MRTPEGFQKGLMYFQKALEKDSSFALAYAGIADCFNLFNYYDLLAPKESFPKARAMAQKALELDDGLAEAPASLGWTLTCYDWDWPGAEREFKRAIKLNPGNPSAHQWYAVYLGVMGRHDESIREARRGQELDPVSHAITFTLAGMFYYTRQYDRAIPEFKKAIELEPASYIPYMFLVYAYGMEKMYEESIAAAQKMLGLLGEKISSRKLVLGVAHAFAGNKDEAGKILKEGIALSEKTYVPPFFIALIYTLVNERDKAFEWLGKDYKERDHYLYQIKVAPYVVDSLRPDPRFKELLKKLGLE